jgi:PAS domain S-box-containing protein
MVNSITLCFVQRNIISHHILIAWFAALSAITLLRFMLLRGYQKAAVEESQSAKWGKRFIAGVAISGVLWGLAAIWMFPENSIAHQVFLAFILCGMVAGAAAVYSAVMGAFLAYSMPALIPIAIRFLVMGGELHLAMAAMTVLFGILMIITATRINQMTVMSLRLQRGKQNLIDFLAEAKEHAETTNEQLKAEIAERRKAEAEIRKHREQLEDIVAERTSALVTTNESLAQEIKERRRTEEELRENERRYRELADMLPQPIFESDLDGNITFANRTAFSCFGYSPEDLQQRLDIYQRIVPEDRDRARETTRRRFAGEKIKNAEYTAQRKDGSRFPILVYASPILRDKQIIGLRGLLIDITERKSTEVALRQAILVIENSPAVLFRWLAAEGWPVAMVSQNVILFGYTPEELLSGEVPFAAIVHPEDSDRVGREVQEHSASGAVRFQQEYRIVTKDGRVRWVDDRTVVERNNEGQVTSYQGVVIDITERQLAEEELKKSHQTFLRVLDGIDATIYVSDMGSYEILFMNKKMIDDTGADLTGRTCYEVLQNQSSPCGHCNNDQLLDADGNPAAVCVWETKNPLTGKMYINHDRAIRWVDGRMARLQIATDISKLKELEQERIRIEEQLRDAQKMETVGRLAGGVAHDFNNMLTAILGHAELAMMQLTSSQPVLDDLKAIKKAAQRSADFVQQLLAVARKQPVSPKVLDLNNTVGGMFKMLKRLIGEDIDLLWSPGASLWAVKIDPSQIDQILANLLVNARDAIAGVGKITIETENIAFDEADCAVHPGLACGGYVMLAISDDGCGMTKEIIGHIFDPFFTTKEIGKGTGLGLATVYGIVKQNDGYISVHSEPGKGTTFKIYLPRFVGEALKSASEGMLEIHKGRGEMVLLVEDEAAILKVSKEMLEKLGYIVVTASTPAEALRQAEAHAAAIRLLITDVIMPEMNGWELAQKVHKTKPGLKCLFTSGYTADVIEHHGVLDEGVQFIQKPFSLKDLASKVRQALERE